MIPKALKCQYLNCGIFAKIIFKILIFSTLFFAENTFSQDKNISERFEIYEDLHFEKLPQNLKKDRFLIAKGIIPDLGWGKFKAWVKLKPEILNGKKYLIIQNPVFDELKIYNDAKELNRISPGKLLSDRAIPFRYPTFEIDKMADREIFVSGITKLNPAKFPIRLFDETDFIAFREKEALKNGLTIGIIAVLVLLNLIIFGVFRLRAFGVFALSATLFAMLYMFLEGYFFGHTFSKFAFENHFINFQYLIYFGFQLSNYWIFSSVFQLEIRKTGQLFTIFRVLFLIAISEGIVMLISPFWYDFLNDGLIRGIGLTLRIGAGFMNLTMLLILLKIKKMTGLAQWFLIAMVPGWLAYLVPRYFPFLFHDFWFTMPQLYSVSVVWYIAVVSLGLATEVYKNLKAEPENEKVLDLGKSFKSEVLSKREIEIMMAFTNGFSYTEISDAMFISPHTVRTHLKNIYSKTGVNSKAEAVRWVLENLK